MRMNNAVFPEDACDVIIDEESRDYSAASFTFQDARYIFRISKITPTKTGQFVTLWKRTQGCPIQPFDLHDAIDFVMIRVFFGDHSGQFVFPKSILVSKNIFSNNGVGGM